MAGTLVITTLSDGTNSTSSTNCIQGSSKSWVNFNGTGTPAIRASYNVSSITKLGTGNYRINMTNAMSDANYAVVGLAQYLTNAGQTILEGPNDATTTTYAVYTKTNTNTVFDSQFISTAVFR